MGAYRQHSMIRPKECIVELKCLKDTKMNYEIKELEKLTLMHDVISKNICCFFVIDMFLCHKAGFHARFDGFLFF